MDIPTISLITTVTLAFVGYFVAYLNNVRLENRKSRLKYINDQLQFLYGPLFSLSHASFQAWQSFRSRCRPGGPFFEEGRPVTPEELEQWRLWMTEVFMPLNLKMEKAIVENAHLIERVEMPKPLQDFLAHVEAYKAVVKKWEEKDFSELTSYIDWPDEFGPYVYGVYKELKRKQAQIIGDIS